MEIEIRDGLASVYFVTDPGKGSFIDSPRVFIIKSRVTIALLAEFFEKLHNQQLRKGLFGTMPQKAEASKLTKLFNDLASLAPVKNFALKGLPETPFVLFCPEIEKDGLNALKILKLRGLVQCAVVALSEDDMTSLFEKLKQEPGLTLLFETDSCLAFSPTLHFAADSSKTVLSKERSRRQFLKSDMFHVQKTTENDPQAFLNEGGYV